MTVQCPKCHREECPGFQKLSGISVHDPRACDGVEMITMSAASLNELLDRRERERDEAIAALAAALERATVAERERDEANASDARVVFIESLERAKKERDAARAKLAETEAACGAMRKVLSFAVRKLEDGGPDEDDRAEIIDRGIAALAPDAARAMLAEVERLRKDLALLQIGLDKRHPERLRRAARWKALARRLLWQRSESEWKFSKAKARVRVLTEALRSFVERSAPFRDDDGDWTCTGCYRFHAEATAIKHADNCKYDRARAALSSGGEGE
jgi:hypothetical protein